MSSLRGSEPNVRGKAYYNADIEYPTIENAQKRGTKCRGNPQRRTHGLMDQERHERRHEDLTQNGKAMHFEFITERARKR